MLLPLFILLFKESREPLGNQVTFSIMTWREPCIFRKINQNGESQLLLASHFCNESISGFVTNLTVDENVLFLVLIWLFESWDVFPLLCVPNNWNITYYTKNRYKLPSVSFNGAAFITTYHFLKWFNLN